MLNGLADLTSGAFGYQNNATTNAGLAANAMYNVATCGGGGSSGYQQRVTGHDVKWAYVVDDVKFDSLQIALM